MGTRFNVENLLITKENADGNIAANPTVIKLCVNKFDLKEAPTFDEKGCLLSDGKVKIKSGAEYSGGVTIDMDANSLPIILTHVLGDAILTEDATTTDWTSNTAMAVKDIVNHTGGIYSLTVVKITGAGLTGGTEPTPTSIGQKIVDGDVTWVVSPKLMKYTFEMKKSAPTLRVEYHLTDGVNSFYKQFKGVEISQFPLSIDGSTSVPELGLDFNTASSIDSEEAGWIKDLLSETGVKLVEFPKDYYGGECELTKVKVNDIEVSDYDSASMTIDKQLKSTPRLNCNQIAERDLKVDGSLTKDFTIEDYNRFREQDTFSLEFNFQTLVGASCSVKFPLVEGTHIDPSFDVKDMVLISPEITATDDATHKIVEAVCVAPQLMSGGVLLGAY